MTPIKTDLALMPLPINSLGKNIIITMHRDANKIGDKLDGLNSFIQIQKFMVLQANYRSLNLHMDFVLLLHLDEQQKY